MKQKELAKLFYKELIKIHEQSELTLLDKVEALYRLLNLIFVDSTRQEKIHFTTLFARIAFSCHKYQIKKQTQFFIHAFRKNAVAVIRKKAVDQLEPNYYLGLKVNAESIAALFKVPIPEDIRQLIPKDDFFQLRQTEIKDFKALARVVVLGEDEKKEQLIIRDEEHPDVELRMQYNIADRNENFNPTIEVIRKIFGFPVVLNLIDIEIDEEETYRPRAIVVEPDYLMDVTAIAECFKDFGAEPLLYLLKKFMPFSQSKHLMIGNIANFFLDELMTNPEISFKEITPKLFQLNPLAFTLFENRTIREILQSSQKHFVNLKRIIHQDLATHNISIEDCYLEPSFYSEQYGLQGRLDVFYKKPNSKKESAIIELKSGKAYRPNIYGISHNHYTQTLLYDLITKSVFGKELNPTNFILYSGVDDKQLRFAPATKSQQFEAIQLRNQLVAIELYLTNLNEVPLDKANILHRLSPSRMPTAKGFIGRDLSLFEKTYRGMSSLELKYFNAFAAFIAREHRLAKTGIQGMENINGLASLWLNEFEEKQENFDIISHLEVKEKNVKAEDPTIRFSRTSFTNPLANFRKGDIAVLYPYDENGSTILSSQIYKGTIVEITKDEVLFRLRSKQYNDLIFDQYENWNLEHDLLDSGFSSMYRSLFAFNQFTNAKKQLLLTTRSPQLPEEMEIIAPKELTEQQQDIFKKLIAAKDYFLLWGPPGTGKTSMMLKHIVKYLINNSNENILLLAYTNKAVDEICEAIESIDEFIKNEYIRIGSKYGTSDRFKSQLLNHKIKDVTKRKELRAVIDGHRIFVATVASMAGKMDLMQLKKFDRVIIDEASQILEPNLIGLLPHFERFVLIGDHKQLPAVVVQSKDESAIHDKELKTIGLHNLRDSLFERLFKRCEQNNWDWAYACLSHQGRMHQDIMDFPNQVFYDGQLKILPESTSKYKDQIKPLDYSTNNDNEIGKRIQQQRMLFFPTAIDDTKGNGKTNIHEAKLICQLVKNFKTIYESQGKTVDQNTIGIITPYRAQIAQIREELINNDINADELSIDTVERYQGGARDIILISLCANRVSQLKSLVSLSDEGVDRKLNVALTRAREHIVLVGNPDILKQNSIYNQLIDYCKMEYIVN